MSWDPNARVEEGDQTASITGLWQLKKPKPASPFLHKNRNRANSAQLF